MEILPPGWWRKPSLRSLNAGYRQQRKWIGRFVGMLGEAPPDVARMELAAEAINAGGEDSITVAVAGWLGTDNP